MYKGKVRVWAAILALFMVCYIVKSANLSDYISKSYDEKKDITFASTNSLIAKNIENEKLDSKDKLIPNYENWNIYLSENKPIAGYDYEEYYSPIVLLYSVALLDNHSDVTYRDGHNYSTDLIYILQAAAEQKTYFQAYPDIANDKHTKRVIHVYADERYEKEIKQSILMTLAGTSNLSEIDYDKYMPRVNEIWDAMEKTSNPLSIDYQDCSIIFTAEYNLLCYGYKEVTFGPTTKVPFYLNYKEGFAEAAKDDKFMKLSCLRRKSYNGAYKKDSMRTTDWTIETVLLDEKINDYCSSNVDITQEEAQAVQEKNEEASVNNSVKEDSETQDNGQNEAGQNEWDINKNESEKVNADRTIDSNAYSVSD